jgi:hypothetical protein
MFFKLTQNFTILGYNKSVPFKMELYSACLRTLDLFTSGFQEKEHSANKLANGRSAASTEKTVDLSLSTLLFDKVSQQQSPRSNSSSNRNGTTTSTATTTTAGIGNNDPMVAMMRHEQTITDLWAQLIGPHTQEVVNTLTSDIVFAPLALKVGRGNWETKTLLIAWSSHWPYQSS